MYVLRQLEDTQRIPHLPVYVDSPMAISVTELYQRHREDHDVEFTHEEAGGGTPNAHKRRLAGSSGECKQLRNAKTPRTLRFASGQATRGRPVCFLAPRLPRPLPAVRSAGR